MTTLYSNIADILTLARQRSYRAVNRTMIEPAGAVCYFYLLAQGVAREEFHSDTYYFFASLTRDNCL